MRSLALRHGVEMRHQKYLDNSKPTVSPKGLILFMMASCSGVTAAPEPGPEAVLGPGAAPGNMERLGFMSSWSLMLPPAELSGGTGAGEWLSRVCGARCGRARVSSSTGVSVSWIVD